MSSYEVSQPILNSPYQEPKLYWYIREGEPPAQKDGRRRAVVWPPRDQKTHWDTSDGTLTPSPEYPAAFELALVNLIRERGRCKIVVKAFDDCANEFIVVEHLSEAHN